MSYLKILYNLSKMEDNKIFSKKNKYTINNVDKCKHYVKNWDRKRGTYLCSGCRKEFYL